MILPLWRPLLMKLKKAKMKTDSFWQQSFFYQIMSEQKNLNCSFHSKIKAKVTQKRLKFKILKIYTRHYNSLAEKVK